MGIILLTGVQAQITYFAENYVYDNYTQLHGVVSYDKDVDDFISGENPLELYFWYDVYVTSWNELNPDFSVSDCNISIEQFPYASNILGIGNVSESFKDSKIFTDDYRNAKYFVRMNDGDLVFFDMFCNFDDTSSGLLVPASFQVVTPTWECKACQYYEWTLLDRDIQKSEQAGNKVVGIVDSIRNVVYLNFEIWLILFWIVLIIIAIHSTGLLFIGIIWLFAYLKGLVD